MENGIIMVVEGIIIIIMVLANWKKTTIMDRHIKLLSDISDSNSGLGTEALSTVNIKKIPIKVLNQSERHIQEYYKRLITDWWSLVDVGTYCKELDQLQDEKKRNFLMSILTQAANDVSLEVYVAMFIKNIIGNINANNRIFYGKIEVGKEFIIKIILNKSAHNFYKKLSTDIDSLLTVNNGFTGEELVIIQSESIQIKKMLQL